MVEQLVTFKTALLAKEKGFGNVMCSTWYTDEGLQTEPPYIQKLQKKPTILAPTHALLQKWLREKHEILVLVVNTNHYPDRFECVAKQKNKNGKWSTKLKVHLYSKYEDALEEGLYQALELVED